MCSLPATAVAVAAEGSVQSIISGGTTVAKSNILDIVMAGSWQWQAAASVEIHASMSTSC